MPLAADLIAEEREKVTHVVPRSIPITVPYSLLLSVEAATPIPPAEAPELKTAEKVRIAMIAMTTDMKEGRHLLACARRRWTASAVREEAMILLDASDWGMLLVYNASEEISRS